MILPSRVMIGIWWCRAVAMMNLSAGSPCSGSGRCDDAIAISGRSGASLIPGPPMKRANQLCGSGRKETAGCLAQRTRLNNPTSQADAGETKIPSASAAFEIAASASGPIGSPLASQMTAQVSSSTALGTGSGFFRFVTGAACLRWRSTVHRVRAPTNRTLRVH